MRLFVVLLGALVLLAPISAHSQDTPWINKALGYNEDGTMRPGQLYCRPDGRCYRVVRTNRPHHKYTGWTERYSERRHRYYENARRYTRYEPRYRDATRVYSYSRRSDEGREVCRESQHVVGDQHLTVEGAKKAANDAWAGTVRFHYGEKFMDLQNARRVNYTCSRSSIKEGSVATLGQTLTRCEVEAIPCHAPRTGDDEK